MQNAAGLIFFGIFAITLFVMYILIRRRIGPASLIAAAGVIISIISFMLFTLAQGNTLVWAVVVGLVIGGLFSATALAAAYYFTSTENRRAKFDPTYNPDTPDQEQP